MSADRRLQRTSTAVERRPVVAGTVQRSAAPAPPSSARTLQSRLGNAGTQALLARSIAPLNVVASDGAAVVGIASQLSIQRSPARRLPEKVSQPTDPAEREAEETARKVMRMSLPATATPASSKKITSGVVQRAEAASGPARVSPSQSPLAHAEAGSPLPSSVRSQMEPRFGASFENVRVHTGESAARDSAALGANAFTIGQHVYFGRDRFQPQSTGGQELIAHELTHTIQQGATVQRDVVHRSPRPEVSARVGSQVQRSFLGIPSPREYFAGKAAAIPGFTMLTVVIGYNPITNARVERSAGNILRAAIQMIPGGGLITDALNAHGVFDAVSAWASAQFEALRDIGTAVVQDIERFIKGFSLTDLADPGALWDQAKAIVMRPIDRVITFARNLKDGIVALIKTAILRPIAAFARTTRGYPLLSAVMGKDPITNEPVAQDAESLLGAFMKFIGEDELWATMQKAKAIPRAFAWFKGAIAGLKGFISEIPALFVKAFRLLEVADIILIPRAFAKLAGVFGGFAVRFVTWGAHTVWTLLEIIFDVVSPGALAYIKKTGGALKSILRNPLPFVGNLVKAAKLGFVNFGAHFLDHLKAGLIDWLTGSLPGIYIPKAFSLGEIAKFAFSVLGLSWANIRQKLVKATSETFVKALETGFDIVVTLVRDGPAAAWDLIKAQLANLKDMVIGGITDFVVDTVVKKAIPKLIAMFIPGAGLISAILSIYDTVMVFVNKIKRIVQVVTDFVDSIVAIAAGQLGVAASRVETALAGVLSLAINFLAGFAGLGKVADKIMGVINKIRAPIDKALDWLVNWIVTAAKKLGSKIFAAGKAAVGKVVNWWTAKRSFKGTDGSAHTLSIEGEGVRARLIVASKPTKLRELLNAVKPLVSGPTAEAHASAVAAEAEFQRLKVIVETTVPPRQPKDIAPMNDQLEVLSLLLPQLVDLLYPPKPKASGPTSVKPDDTIRIISGDVIAKVTKVGPPPMIPGGAQYAPGAMFVEFKVLSPRGKSAARGFLTTAVGRDWEPYGGDLRELYLGSPNKTALARKVKARMQAEGLYDPTTDTVKEGGNLVPAANCDLSHVVDAVHWWNTEGRFRGGARSPAVRKFMNDPNNYILESSAANRKRGAELAARGVRYLPPP
jgi:hypothetical protein